MFKIVPQDLNVDFVGKTKMMAGLSLLLIVASIVAFFVVKPNYGIDFRGGSDIILSFTEDVTSDQVRKAALTIFDDAQVQTFGSDGRRFKVQTQEISVVNGTTIDEVKKKLEAVGEIDRVVWDSAQPDRLDAVYKANVEPSAIKTAVESVGLKDVTVEKTGVEGNEVYVVRFQDLGSRIREGFGAAFPTAFIPMKTGDKASGLEELVTVGPRVGDQLKNSAIFSVIVALFLILIYIAFRFDIRYAPGAVVALTHDVIIAGGFFVAIGMELNLPIIAAILTIVGYSLNDTIVVFDRIRENLTEEGDSDIVGVVNRSINETLSRTLMTSLTTLVAVVAIYVLGGGLISDFALALIAGILVGTYSSVFVASPVMLFMDRYLRMRRSNQQAAATTA